MCDYLIKDDMACIVSNVYVKGYFVLNLKNGYSVQKYILLSTLFFMSTNVHYCTMQK